jgi:hypothetical protein
MRRDPWRALCIGHGTEAQESSDKIQTIFSFGRMYAPDPAEDCFKALEEYGSHANMHLNDLQ